MSVRFVIDPLDFVRNAGVRRDKIPVFQLTRLHDLLYDQEGEVTYQIRPQFWPLVLRTEVRDRRQSQLSHQRPSSH